MTRYRELATLRARVTALLATMETVAGSAPDFVRRYDRGTFRGEADYAQLYFGLRGLLEQAASEAHEVVATEVRQ